MDPQFETVYADSGEPPPEWEDLLICNQYCCDMDLEIDGAPELDEEWTVDCDAPAAGGRHSREEERRRRSSRNARGDSPIRPQPPSELLEPPVEDDYPANLPTTPRRPDPRPEIRTPSEAIRERTSQREEAPRSEEARTRPRQERKPVDRLTYGERGNPQWKSHLSSLVSLLAVPRPKDAPMFDPLYMSTLMIDPEEGTIEDVGQGYGRDVTPWSLAAKKGKRDPDYPTYAETMAGPQRDTWIESQKKEIAQLERMKCWEEVDRKSVPGTASIIKSCWAFRIARLPSGEIKKFKSRFCARGDTQVDDALATYLPVVSWSTVRVLLSLLVQLALKTRAIDISLAFITADIAEGRELYLKMPKRIRKGR